MVPLERTLLLKIVEHLDDPEFIIITGARQTGKTTIINQLYDKLKENREEVYSFTLEDHNILTRLNLHPENLFEFVIRPTDKRLFVLLDEVQYLNDPSNFLKLLYDKHHTHLKIIATGSSAFYIDRKFKDSLAGRKILFELYTLGFDEFLLFRTGDGTLTKELDRIRTHENYISLRRNELESYFGEYLVYGGYPAVVLADTIEKKQNKLKEITSSYLKRDVTESNIQEQGKFYYLLLLLAQQTGSLININELSKTLKLSVTAIENYLYILQKCFHIHLLRPFYRNIRKELTKMPKVYFNDQGFRNVLLNYFDQVFQRPDKGQIIENYAFIRLRELYGTENLHYWRTTDGKEIDFIVNHSFNKGEALEIKFDAGNYNPSKYQKFIETYLGYKLNWRAFRADSNTNLVMAL